MLSGKLQQTLDHLEALIQSNIEREIILNTHFFSPSSARCTTSLTIFDNHLPDGKRLNTFFQYLNEARFDCIETPDNIKKSYFTIHFNSNVNLWKDEQIADLQVVFSQLHFLPVHFILDAGLLGSLNNTKIQSLLKSMQVMNIEEFRVVYQPLIESLDNNAYVSNENLQLIHEAFPKATILQSKYSTSKHTETRPDHYLKTFELKMNSEEIEGKQENSPSMKS